MRVEEFLDVRLGRMIEDFCLTTPDRFVKIALLDLSGTETHGRDGVD